MKFLNHKLMDIDVKTVVFLITYIILGILGLLYFKEILYFIGIVFEILSPFIIGIILAFLFQLPTRFIYNHLKIEDERKKTLLASVISIFVVFFVVIILLVIILPQIIENLVTLTNNIPTMLETGEKYLDIIIEKLSLDDQIVKNIENLMNDFGTTILSYVSKVAPTIMSTVNAIVNSVMNIFMGIVIAIYMTLDKERLLKQCNKVGYALLDNHIYQMIKDVMNLIIKTFKQFFTGQITESVIIGVLCYIGCKLLSIPYASIAGVVIGVTNVIPYFGPFIGAGISALLILFVSPIKAIVFIIFSMILQQVESNLIYPHVVGSSIGLSALWVLFAITIGGGLFGIVGMIFGLPVFSVIYELFRRYVNKKIKMKKDV